MGPLAFFLGTVGALYPLFRTFEGACEFADSALDRYVALPTEIQILHPTGGAAVANRPVTVIFNNKTERTIWDRYTKVLMQSANALYGKKYTSPTEMTNEEMSYAHQFLYTWHCGHMPDDSVVAQAIARQLQKAVQALSDEQKHTVSSMFSLLNALEREGRIK